ncbi:MAG: YaaA family protein [Schleiferiaceae bacterium]
MNSPLVLLSPSKGMAAESPFAPWSHPTPPHFPARTTAVVQAVQALSAAEKKVLFKVSDALFESTTQLWNPALEEFLAPEGQGVPGVFAYSGEAFKSLDASSLSVDALNRAKDALVVLSGLYGVVTGGVNVRPYRLEMQSKLAVEDARNLYAWWKPVLTEWLDAQSAPFIINACSGEYSKAVDWKSVRTAVIHVDFKQMKNGTMKSISAFSKQARGTFARWVLQENVQTIFGLASFTKDGYQLLSHEGDKMVFLRP